MVPEMMAKFLRKQRQRGGLVRHGKTAKAKTRRDSKSDLKDQNDEDGDDDDDDDGSEIGSDVEDEDGSEESDCESPTVASMSKQASSCPSTKTSIVCASLIVAPSCTVHLCCLVMNLLRHAFLVMEISLSLYRL
jgi:hypothetical protein